MYYYESPTTDPYENLASEEHLFETLPAGAGLFMLWQNSDAVIVGKYQNTAEEVHAAYVREHGVAVVRRMSGGGAVYHDLGGLNYTLILDEESPCGAEDPELPAGSSDAAEQDAVWRQCMAPLLAVLRSYGLDAQFSGRNDILVRSPQPAADDGGAVGDDAADDWRKIAGCAQYSRGSRTLHHGCILFDTDLEKVAAALTPGEAKFVSRSDKSVRTRVTTIRACQEKISRQESEAMPEQSGGKKSDVMNEMPRQIITMEQFQQDLRRAYDTSAPYLLTAEDWKAIRKLRDEKYRTWEWNYGFRADYQVHRERRFAAGLVAADMDVRGGCIEAVRFSGDFFADGDIAALEEALQGLLLDEQLAEHLQARLGGQDGPRQGGCDSPIRGVSIEELARLLTE